MAQPKTPEQEAAERAQQLLGPQIAAAQEAARNQAASAQAAYEAAAKMQEGVAPAIEKTYAGATSREAVIAKGLALGAQLAGQETSGASNALLGQQGSPQQVQAGDIGSILASLGGMSAGNLNREGAAFSAAAQFLPGQSRLLGADAAKAAGSQGATAVGALEAQRAGLVSGSLQQILERMRADKSLESDILFKKGEAKRADRALTVQEQYLLNSQRDTGSKITGIDPFTGQPTFENTTTTTVAAAAKAKARTAALGKRNDATATALLAAGDWVEEQLKPGTALTPKGQVPIESHKVKRGKETITYYIKKGGGTTTKVAEAETKTVYDEQLIPKGQYDELYNGLRRQLTTQLRRYGYKPKQISVMADDILSDYFKVVGGEAPNPTQVRPGSVYDKPSG